MYSEDPMPYVQVRTRIAPLRSRCYPVKCPVQLTIRTFLSPRAFATP